MSEGSAQPETVRAFMAVPLDGTIIESLAIVQKKLRWTGARVAWVPTANLHVTMAFLGYIPEESGAGLTDVLDRAAAGCRPFALEVAGLGTFGRPTMPRVVWAGVREGAAELTALQNNLAAGLQDLGFKQEDRAFHPHVTLGRVKSAQNVGALLKTVEEGRDRNVGRQTVDRMLLMKSILMPSGARYIIWHEAKLKG